MALIILTALIASGSAAPFVVAVTSRPHPSAHPVTSGVLGIEVSQLDASMRLLTAQVRSVSGADAHFRAYAVPNSSLPKLVSGAAQVPLLGLAAGEEHVLTVVVEALLQRLSDGVQSVHTQSSSVIVQPNHPEAYGIPTITTLVADRKRMAPGWTWWSAFAAGNNTAWAGSLMTDEDGALRWVADCTSIFKAWWPALLNPSYKCAMTGTQSELANGNVVMMWTIENGMVDKTGLTGLVEVQPNGTVTHCWIATKLMPGKSNISPRRLQSRLTRLNVFVLFSSSRLPAWQLELIPNSPAPVNGTKRTVTVVRLDAWVINHDIQELPSNGNWMVIAFEQRSGETRERARRESTHGACTHFLWRGSENAKVEEAPNAPLTSPPAHLSLSLSLFLSLFLSLPLSSSPPPPPY